MLPTVVSFAYNHVQVFLTLRDSGSYPCFENLFCLFDILPVEVYTIGRNTVHGVVGAEDELRGLFVVGGCLGLVLFAGLGEGVGFCAGAGGVCLVRLRVWKMMWVRVAGIVTA